MKRANVRYLQLYTQRKRLMTLNVKENKDRINILTAEIDALRASGEVSQEVIDLAPYASWR